MSRRKTEPFSGQAANEDGDYTEHNPHCLQGDLCACSYHPDVYEETALFRRFQAADAAHHAMIERACQPGAEAAGLIALG